MRPRSLARRLALQYLYAAESTGWVEAESVDAFLEYHCDREDAADFARDLIEAVLGARDEIDQTIVQVAENWALERIAPVERAILRIGCAEFRARTAPPKVILDEAVNLAKHFGGKDSGAFVNGVLDRIHHSMGERRR